MMIYIGIIWLLASLMALTVIRALRRERASMMHDEQIHNLGIETQLLAHNRKALIGTGVLWAGLILLSFALWKMQDVTYVDVLFFTLLIISSFSFSMIYSYYRYMMKNSITQVGILPRASIKQVDLQVVQNVKVSGIYYVGMLLIGLASLIPFIYFTFTKEIEAEQYPWIISFVGPLVILGYSLGLRQVQRNTPKLLTDNTQKNIQYAKSQVRLYSIMLLASAMNFTTLWLSLNYFIVRQRMTISLVIVFVLVIVVQLIIPHYYQQAVKKVDQRFNIVHINPLNEPWLSKETAHRVGGVYNNPYDSRVVVPKRNPAMGWTINLGNRKGRAVTGFIAVILISLISFVFYITLSNYQFKLTDSSFVINAPLYGKTITKEAIESIRLVDHVSTIRRDNGVGMINKQFGYFSTKEYGRGMLYTYAKETPYILLTLTEDEPIHYVLLNENSDKETRHLYTELTQWLE